MAWTRKDKEAYLRRVAASQAVDEAILKMTEEEVASVYDGNLPKWLRNGAIVQYREGLIRRKNETTEVHP